jgi:hypothetical protein
VIRYQGVQSCACLKLLVVINRYFVVCLVGVWPRNFDPVVCAYGPAGWELLYYYSVCTVRPAGNYCTTTVCVWSGRLGTTVVAQ